MDVIRETSYPILKYSKIKESLELDYSKPPSLSIKVDNIYDKLNDKPTDKLDIKVYDKNRNLIYPNENPDDAPMNYVTKGSTVVAIIKCNSVWIGPNNWGITFRAVQIVVVSKGDSLNTNVCQIKFEQIDDDDDDNNNSNKNVKKATIETVQKPVVTSTFNVPPKSETFIEDDDDEEPQPVVKKPEPEPEPTKMVDDDDDDDDDDDEPPKQPVKQVVSVTDATPKKIVKKIVKKSP